MATGPTVGQYHFDEWNLPTKYGWMHSGTGMEAATEVQDLVDRMSQRMIESGERVRSLLGGAEWAGAAAEVAGQAMQRGAGQITQSAAGTTAAERYIAELGESFVTAQHRMPSPNEIPTGLGDAFLFGAAEGFNTLSPFDVQSPLHEALEQRRELERQANQALTDHMTTSRDRVEAMPVVTAPAPMTVVTQSAGTQSAATSRVGGVGQPARSTPAVAGVSGVPTLSPLPASTNLADAGAAPLSAPTAATPSTGGGSGGTPLLPSVPVGTDPAQTSGPGGGVRPRPAGAAPTGAPAAGSGWVGAAPGPRSSGQVGAGAAAPRGAGFGARPGVGGPSGGPSGGPAGGPASESAMAGRGGAASPAGAGGARSSGLGSFLQPAVGGRRSGDDAEHQDRYAQRTDHIVGELPPVAPAVIGETPEEEELRLRRYQDDR